MLFIARRHFVRRDHRQSRRGEGKNEKQRCEKAKVLVPPAHSIPPVDLLFSVRAPPSYANSPQRFRGGGEVSVRFRRSLSDGLWPDSGQMIARTILRTAQSAAVAVEPLGDGKRILEPGVGKIVDDRLLRELEALARPLGHPFDDLEAFGAFLDGGKHRLSLSESLRGARGRKALAMHEKMRRWHIPTVSFSPASWAGPSCPPARRCCTTAGSSSTVWREPTSRLRSGPRASRAPCARCTHWDSPAAI